MLTSAFCEKFASDRGLKTVLFGLAPLVVFDPREEEADGSNIGAYFVFDDDQMEIACKTVKQNSTQQE